MSIFGWTNSFLSQWLAGTRCAALSSRYGKQRLRRNKPSCHAELSVEQLEDRTVLSPLVVVFVDGTELVLLDIGDTSHLLKVAKSADGSKFVITSTAIPASQELSLDGGLHKSSTVIVPSAGITDLFAELGAGNDRLDLATLTLPCIVFGGLGNDTLIGSKKDDFLFGEEGDDSVRGKAGNDTVSGGDGTDYVDGGLDTDLLVECTDAALVTVTATSITGVSPAGSELLRGVEGVQLEGGGGANKFDASTSTRKVILFGGGGADTLLGGSANDHLFGEDDDDSIKGGSGHDTILGGTGNDMLLGGSGNDVILGEGHDDMIDGQGGQDSTTGGGNFSVTTGGDSVVADALFPDVALDDGFVVTPDDKLC